MDKAPVELPGRWPWGIFPELKRDLLGTLTRIGALGDVVRARIGPLTVYFVNFPEGVRRILHEPRIYDKRTVSYDRMRPILGQGLVTSEGDFWLRQRRIAQPAFHRQRVAGFAEVMARIAREAAARWEGPAARGEPFDAAAEMTRITLAVVCETLFGGDVGRDGEAVARCFDELNHLVSDRQKRFVPAPLWLPTGENRRLRRALDEVDAAIYRIIARRRGEPAGRADLLAMLMEARDEETGGTMTDRQLRDEVATMLLAGYETTAVALSWALYLLARHPEAEARLRGELAALGGRPPAIDDLPRLPYARMVVEESMRLYPPVWATARRVAQEDRLDGYRLPRGAQLMFASWVLHRSPALWPDPLAFRPERFAPEHAESIPRFAYFPFIGGPRQCIGNAFALLEAQLVLATLLQRWRLRLASDEAPEPEPLLTLRPKGGIRMIASAA